MRFSLRPNNGTQLLHYTNNWWRCLRWYCYTDSSSNHSSNSFSKEVCPHSVYQDTHTCDNSYRKKNKSSNREVEETDQQLKLNSLHTEEIEEPKYKEIKRMF